MTTDKHRNGVCGQIDEESIELHAMGRLAESSLLTHLDMCEFCRGRVAEHRSWIEDLKMALQRYRQAEQTAEARGGADQASRFDES
jgi:hypothetical protein